MHKSYTIPMFYSISYNDSFGDKVTYFAVMDDFGNLVKLENKLLLTAHQYTRQ